MSKKWMYALPLSLTGILLGYQNCSKVDFGASDDRITTAGTYTLTPGTENTAADAKILLVIDNSESMRQAQQYLSNGVDSLLESLSGRSFELKIITTTPHQGLKHVSESYVLNSQGQEIPWNNATPLNPDEHPVGTQYGWKDSQHLTASSDTSITGCSYVGSVLTCETAATYFTYEVSEGAAGFDSIKQSIKENVLKLGTAGGDNEQGLCPLLKSLYSTTHDKFFKDGDKVGIVILSDENDSSTYESCLNKQVRNWRIYEWSDTTMYQYRLRVPSYNIQVEYQYISDGVVRTGVTHGSHALSTTPEYTSKGQVVSDPTNIVHQSNCSVTRTSLAEERVRSRPFPYNGTYVRTIECKYNYAEQSLGFPGNIFANLQIPTNIANPNYVNLCTQGFTLPAGTMYNNVNMAGTYTGIRDYYQKLLRRLAEQNGGPLITPRVDSNAAYCVHTNTSRQVSNLNEQAPRPHVLFGTMDPELASTQDLKIGIRNRMQQMFGSRGFFLSSIVLTNQCNVGSNQSLGQNYIALSNVLENQGSVHRICQNDYSEAMTQISQYIDQAVAQSLRVNMSSNLHISSVSVLRGADTISLTRDTDYEVTGNVIQFTGFELQQTDFVIVTVELND